MIIDMATGMPCNSINIDLCMAGKLNKSVVKKAMEGRNIILNMLSFKASVKLVYFLP